MATFAPDLPAGEPETFGNDLAGIPNFYIDPVGAGRRLHTKWFWVGPLVVISIAGIIIAAFMMPIVQHVMEIAPIPEGQTAEQHQKGMEIGLTFVKVFSFLSPVIAAAMLALEAAILLAASSVMGVKASFRALFNLVSGCAMILLLESIATLVILKAKGDISTMAELKPPLGLDIFLAEGTNKFVLAFLGFFSVFEIWWAVMMALILASAFRVSKGKAFAVVAPLVLLGLLWHVGAAVFQK
jgi:Yip1 domain